MFKRNKLLITIVGLLISFNTLQAQNGFFVALTNTGLLYSINTATCDTTRLTTCYNLGKKPLSGGYPLSIGMDGNTLYTVTDSNYLYSATISATGITNCKKIGTFLSGVKNGAQYGMTVGPDHIVYVASGSTIETYNANTGKFGTLGSLPAGPKWTIGGDLLFYKGDLYEAVQINGSQTNDALIKIDTLNPSLSTLYLNFTKGDKIFGFASVTVPCNNNQCYALSDTGKNTYLYAVDMTNKTQSATIGCKLPFLVYDAASLGETESSTPPLPPTVVSPIKYCQNDPISPLSATVATNVDTLKWYTVSTGGTATGQPVPAVSSVALGTVIYYVSDFDTSTKCESIRDSILVTVNPYPTVPTINPLGPDTICPNTTLLLTSTALATNTNQWYLNNSIIKGATNTSYSAGAIGNYTIETTTAAGCSKTSIASVIALTQATISYSGSPFCPSGTKAVTQTGDTGGRYSVTPVGLVIDSITGTLNLANSKSGTYTVTYTVGPNHCPFTTQFTIQPQSAAFSYTKPAFCKSAGSQSITFAPGSVTTGTFTASPAGLSISANGTINTAASTVGNYQVLYTYGTAGVGCGVATTFDSVSIIDVPVVPAITGPNKLCTGSTITLVDTLAGGTWSSSNNAIATVSASGLVAAITTGNPTITYSVTNSCGTIAPTQQITITNGPVTQPILGSNSVCISKSITLTDATTGGVWTSSDSSVATLNGGVVTGVKVGTAIITYSVVNTCGVAAQSQTITVNAAPVVGPITGNDSVCVNATLQLSDTTLNGTWTSGNNSTAGINTSGLVTGIAGGTTTISYSSTNSCGTTIQTKDIVITSGPVLGNITGTNSVCVNSTVQLANTTPGGVWSSGSPANATINNTGLVTGVAVGSTIISYALSNSCGSTTQTYSIKINDIPVVSNITGKDTVCVKSTIQLADLTASGTWSSSNQNATVSNTGLVTGVTSGNTLISYTVTNVCGTTPQTYNVVINDAPKVGAITGNDTICSGSSNQLSDSTTGGIWSSTNTAVATVSSTGLVTAFIPGNTTISYSVTNSCGTSSSSQILVINNGALTQPIKGDNTVCVNKSITLTDATAGGSWTSNNNAIATVNGGVVTGVAAGSVTITYNINSSCGAAPQTQLITVNGPPVVGLITGNDTLCTNTNFELEDTTASGIWSSSNTQVATIDVTGIVNGLAVGNSTISYTVTNTCGTTTQTKNIVVNTLPVVANIKGDTTVCTNATIQLTDATTGGIWSSSKPDSATVSNTGLVTGVAYGTTIISYAVTNTCGTTIQPYKVNINPVPFVNPILGDSFVCTNNTIQLSDVVPGGTWTSSNAAAATINNTGLLTGVATGATNITYTVTNTCGTVWLTRTINVNAAPIVSNIAGSNTVCINTTTLLTDTTPGGIWSSSNPSVGFINSHGVLLGLSPGLDTITYSVTNACGTTAKYLAIVSNTIPVVNPIMGKDSICVNSSLTLTDNTVGGIWSSSNTNIAAVNSTGQVSGVSTGLVSIYYSVTNACGTVTQPFDLLVNDVPVVGVIAGDNSLCINTQVQLINVTPGGVWSSGNPAIATVNNTGFVSAIAAGKDTISYSITNTCGTTTRTIDMIVLSAPVGAPIKGNDALCDSTSIVLTDSITGGTWTSSNPAVVTIDNNGLVTTVAPGLAVITYDISNSCGALVETHPLTVNAKPISAISTLPVVADVCLGQPITLIDNTTGATVNTSIWNLGNNVTDTGLTITYTYTDAYNYLVTHKIIDKNGCVSKPSKVLVTIQALPTVSLLHEQFVLQNDSITLYPIVTGLDHQTTIIWTPETYLTNATTLNPVCTPLSDTTYTLTITNAIGCKGSDTTRIVVLDPISIPNAFSPNGDGTHDTWDIPNLYKYPHYKLLVFDRNGQVVFESHDYYNPWNGKYRQQDVPMGTYWYILDRGFKLPVLSGSLTILR